MSKKEPLETLCVKLPPRWIKRIKEQAIRLSTTKTQVIKNWIIDKCING